MIATIHQPQFLPYLGFFHKVRQSDVLVLLDDVQFQKHGFQNRNLIKSHTGSQWLTVPVMHNFGQLIREVTIGQTISWRKKHWAALQTNYGGAPFFRTLAEDLHTIFIAGTQTHLLSIDLELLRWAMAKLGIVIPIRLSSDLDVAGAQTERLVSICRAVGADTYLSGPGGRGYMDIGLFEQAGIEIRFQEYSVREYPQMFPARGFLPNLAIIDALFNLGEQAATLIAS